MKQYFELSTTWKSTFPEAHAGVLVMRDVANPAQHAALESQKAALEAQLHAQWLGQDRVAMANHPVLRAYQAYYRRFKKTYHVQLQLESIVLKGRSLPSVAGLVEAMFMAEVENLLLTAGHDLDVLDLPIRLEVANGDEYYTLLQGQEQVLKAGDMLMADRTGVISSILYGPDRRTQITAGTRNVVYTVYAPTGIDGPTVQRHLQTIQQNVLLIAPKARVELSQVFG
jgi:DNA/RNA-binding domain of Phe-tRNA-synthetase-like protein